MSWFFVDDGFSDSKPIMNLSTAPVRVPMRIAVAGAWVLGGSWSAKEELDGFVPHSKLKSLLVPRSVVAAMCEPGPLDASLCCPDSDGISVKNWAKWQRTKAENEARRKREAEKKRGQRRRGRSFVTGMDDQLSLGDIPGDDTGDSENVSPGDSRSPTPPHPIVGNSGVCSPVGSTPDETHTRPPEWCQDHPGGTTTNCGPCANHRRVAQAWDDEHEQAETHARADELAQRKANRTRIAECPDCDENGMDVDDDGVAHRCTHPKTQAVSHA